MPIVTLKMGPSLNPDDIKEGDGVYFECHIRSNPKPYKMSWFLGVSRRKFMNFSFYIYFFLLYLRRQCIASYKNATRTPFVSYSNKFRCIPNAHTFGTKKN